METKKRITFVRCMLHRYGCLYLANLMMWNEVTARIRDQREKRSATNLNWIGCISYNERPFALTDSRNATQLHFSQRTDITWRIQHRKTVNVHVYPFFYRQILRIQFIDWRYFSSFFSLFRGIVFIIQCLMRKLGQIKWKECVNSRNLR